MRLDTRHHLLPNAPSLDQRAYLRSDSRLGCLRRASRRSSLDWPSSDATQKLTLSLFSLSFKLCGRLGSDLTFSRCCVAFGQAKPDFLSLDALRQREFDPRWLRLPLGFLESSRAAKKSIARLWRSVPKSSLRGVKIVGFSSVVI